MTPDRLHALAVNLGLPPGRKSTRLFFDYSTKRWWLVVGRHRQPLPPGTEGILTSTQAVKVAERYFAAQKTLKHLNLPQVIEWKGRGPMRLVNTALLPAMWSSYQQAAPPGAPPVVVWTLKRLSKDQYVARIVVDGDQEVEAWGATGDETMAACDNEARTLALHLCPSLRGEVTP